MSFINGVDNEENPHKIHRSEGMSPDHCPGKTESGQPKGHSQKLRIVYWISGLGSLAWLLFRSGSNPKRLAYPCQRAAAASSVSFLAYFASTLSIPVLLHKINQKLSRRGLVLIVSILSTVVLFSSVGRASFLSSDNLELTDWTSGSAISNVFAVHKVPEPQYSLDGGDLPTGVAASDALPDVGVDALINLMEAKGDYFYKTITQPNGIFASDDVVVIKVNNQWDGRNGTNTDVLKGVIYRLAQHPDGFTGSVIVAENSQNYNDDWAHQTSGNNSQFQDQSYQEVVQAFAGDGYSVCISDWKGFWDDIVDDYDQGDNSNGYVILDADSSTTEQGHGRLSYPKFSVNCNGNSLAISMKNGLWNGSSYDVTHLKWINMPVLKRHNSAWGTISMKNYLGFVTLYDEGFRWVSPGYKHCWIMGEMDNGTDCTAYTETYGLIGRQMANISMADLNIVDAIWVNPRDNAAYHSEARRENILLASRDPFAVDYYTSEYVLYPLIDAYGSTSTPDEVQASNHGGWFRNGLRNNNARFFAEGGSDVITINNSMTREQELAQFNVYVVDSTKTIPTTPIEIFIPTILASVTATQFLTATPEPSFQPVKTKKPSSLVKKMPKSNTLDKARAEKKSGYT